MEFRLGVVVFVFDFLKVVCFDILFVKLFLMYDYKREKFVFGDDVFCEF